MRILDLYCSVDMFWQRFEPRWEREPLASRQQVMAATFSHRSTLVVWSLGPALLAAHNFCNAAQCALSLRRAVIVSSAVCLGYCNGYE
jgi:hypothetical protein